MTKAGDLIALGLNLAMFAGLALGLMTIGARSADFYRRLMPVVRPVSLLLIAVGALLVVIGITTT